MTAFKTVLLAFPLLLAVGGCVANDPVSTDAEIEQTIDSDINGDGLIAGSNT